MKIDLGNFDWGKSNEWFIETIKQEFFSSDKNVYETVFEVEENEVVMDVGAAHVWDIPRDQSKYKDDHPILAIEEFLKNNNNFEIDHHYNRLGITSSPLGFLKKTNG